MIRKPISRDDFGIVESFDESGYPKSVINTYNYRIILNDLTNAIAANTIDPRALFTGPFAKLAYRIDCGGAPRGLAIRVLEMAQSHGCEYVESGKLQHSSVSMIDNFIAAYNNSLKPAPTVTDATAQKQQDQMAVLDLITGLTGLMEDDQDRIATAIFGNTDFIKYIGPKADGRAMDIVKKAIEEGKVEPINTIIALSRLSRGDRYRILSGLRNEEVNGMLPDMGSGKVDFSVETAILIYKYAEDVGAIAKLEAAINNATSHRKI